MKNNKTFFLGSTPNRCGNREHNIDLTRTTNEFNEIINNFWKNYIKEAEEQAMIQFRQVVNSLREEDLKYLDEI
jgi:hypothetical protein